MIKNILLISLFLSLGTAEVLAQGCIPKATFERLFLGPNNINNPNQIALLKNTNFDNQGANELFSSLQEVAEYVMELDGIEYKLTIPPFQPNTSYYTYNITPSYNSGYKKAKVTFYADADGDGVSCNRDCDDNNASIVTTPETWYADADGDGYVSNVSIKSCNNPSTASVTYYIAGTAPNGSGDCNDNDASIHPGKTEMLFSGKDDDCNPATQDNPAPGNCLHFDGTNDGVDCGNAASLQITGSITLETMVKFDRFETNTYEGNIINKESSTGNNGYALRVGGNGIINFLLGNGTWIETNTDANTLQLNTWYHIACTWDNVTKAASIYVNGVLKKQTTIPQLSGIGVNNSNLWLGTYYGTGRHSQITLDEVRIWNIARSLKEINNAMNCELKGQESGLAAYYKFNQGFNAANNSTYTNLPDAANKGNKGTLTNFGLTGATSNWLSTSPITTGTSCNTGPELSTIGNKTIDEDTELSFIITANDAETPSSLSYSLDAASLAKGMSINATTGGFKWTPDNTQAGTHSVTVTVTDNKLDDSETFTITVNAVNDAPVLTAIGDKTVDEDTELSFTVTANDEETPTALSYSLDAASLAKGMTIDATSGEFSWTPDNNQIGTHSVTITVTDSKMDDSETFTITVNPVNDAPVLATIGNKTIDEDKELSFTVTANDEETPSSLSYSLDAASLAKGMSIDETSGEFSWTPDNNQTGDHEVTITVSDGELSDSETFTITVNSVNDAPVLATIGDKTIDEDTELSFTVTANDEETPSSLSFSLDAASLAKGMSIDETSGEFSWIPDNNQIGTHSVTITVTDSKLDDSETFTITVNPVNDAPVLSTIGNKTIDEDKELSFTVTANDEETPSSLSFSLDATSVVKGMSIDETSGEFSWIPDNNQIGTHSVTITVTDSKLDDSETFTITVNAVNDAPVLAAIGDKTIDEDTELSFTVTANDEETPTSLSYSLDAASLAKGMAIDATSGIFKWTPDNDQTGEHEVTIYVSDGELRDNETIVITVNPVNDAPVLATIENKTIDEDTELSFTVTANDEETPSSLSFSLDATSVAKGMSIDETSGEFSWIPDNNQIGTHSVTITVTDSKLDDSETFTITVNAVNDAPVLTAIGDKTIDEDTELSFTVTANDEETPALLSYSLDAASLTKGMSIDATSGEFSWTPDNNQIGTHSVTITVTDSKMDDSETFIITVNPVNDAPVLATIGNKTIDEDKELSFTVTANDEETPSSLSYSLDAASLAKGMSIDGGSGEFSWTPDDTQVGAHEVTIYVSDGELSDSETITITVNGITGITNDLSSTISLSPNPASGPVFIKLSVPNSGIVWVKSLEGHTITSIPFENSDAIEVQWEGKSGLYIVEIQTKEGVIVRQKIVRN